MADLVLSGTLNLTGELTLNASSGGKVKVGTYAVLVQLTPNDDPHCTMASPVMMPPPPAGPIGVGPNVWIINSFNPQIKVGSKNIVTQGLVIQGTPPTWPGMVLPSQGNSTVTINHIAINVENDQAIIFPSGGTASFSASGQQA